MHLYYIITCPYCQERNGNNSYPFGFEKTLLPRSKTGKTKRASDNIFCISLQTTLQEVVFRAENTCSILHESRLLLSALIFGLSSVRQGAFAPPLPCIQFRISARAPQRRLPRYSDQNDSPSHEPSDRFRGKRALPDVRKVPKTTPIFADSDFL